MFQNPEIMNKYGSNLDMTENLYIATVVNEDYGFCLFASYATINMVKLNIEAQHRHYLIDGTFSCSPKIFYQLLIISVEYKNDVSVVISINFFLFSTWYIFGKHFSFSVRFSPYFMSWWREKPHHAILQFFSISKQIYSTWSRKKWWPISKLGCATALKLCIQKSPSEAAGSISVLLYEKKSFNWDYALSSTVTEMQNWYLRNSWVYLCFLQRI